MDIPIKQIVLHEWNMIGKVNSMNENGASHGDFITFNIMRTSQFEAWDKPTRNSYYADIVKAEKEERNLMTERYAYMMEYTVPQEFSVIKNYLPKISVKKEEIISKIVEIQLAWAEEVSIDYPMLYTQGRPLKSIDDNPDFVSVETFMIGELKTYSMETLKLYLHHLENLDEVGENISPMVLKNIVKKYGAASLEEAEERMKRFKSCY